MRAVGRSRALLVATEPGLAQQHDPGLLAYLFALLSVDPREVRDPPATAKGVRDPAIGLSGGPANTRGAPSANEHFEVIGPERRVPALHHARPGGRHGDLPPLAVRRYYVHTHLHAVVTLIERHAEWVIVTLEVTGAGSEPESAREHRIQQAAVFRNTYGMVHGQHGYASAEAQALSSRKAHRADHGRGSGVGGVSRVLLAGIGRIPATALRRIALCEKSVYVENSLAIDDLLQGGRDAESHVCLHASIVEKSMADQANEASSPA